MHDLDATSLGKSCVDVLVAGSPSLDLVDHVSSDSFDMFHASPSCSPPSHSPECCDMLLIDSHVMLEGIEVDYLESLGTFKGYDPSFYPYNLYLEDMLGKIMLLSTFDFS